MANWSSGLRKTSALTRTADAPEGHEHADFPCAPRDREGRKRIDFCQRKQEHDRAFEEKDVGKDAPEMGVPADVTVERQNVVESEQGIHIAGPIRRSAGASDYGSALASTGR